VDQGARERGRDPHDRGLIFERASGAHASPSARRIDPIAGQPARLSSLRRTHQKTATKPATIDSIAGAERDIA
jgi:hypothetical protein